MKTWLVAMLAGCAVAGSSVPASAQPADVDAYVLFGTTDVRVGALAVVEHLGVGTNGLAVLKARSRLEADTWLAAERVKASSGAVAAGPTWANRIDAPAGAIQGPVSPASIPVLTLPPPPTVSPGTFQRVVPPGATVTVSSDQEWGLLEVKSGGTLVLHGNGLEEAVFHVDRLIMRGEGAAIRCTAGSCRVLVASRLTLGASSVAVTGSPMAFEFAGTSPVVLGRPGSVLRATLHAPLAKVRLKSSRSRPTDLTGRIAAARIAVGSGAHLRRFPPPVCGNDTLEVTEDCDGADDEACPGRCEPDCDCPPGPPVLHSVGPSVLHNATSFGVQLVGDDFQVGATLELRDKTSGAVIQVLPTTFVSPNELTALVPAGMPVPSGIQRELDARVVNPDGSRSLAAGIGRCTTDAANAPVACLTNADCAPGTGPCVTGIQRLTMFNDRVFLNPSSAALAPAPHGVCEDGTPCQSAAACAGIGGGACAPKLYVTPQQVDELWVYDTGTGRFVDRDAGLPGIQGIPVGDNPFHVEILDAGGGIARAWVVNRFDDSISIVDPAADVEIARVTGADLGAPGRLRMGTEIEFNRAGTRAYVSNQNLDEVQVLDVAGARRDAPVLLDTIDVGVNPRGMATNAAGTRLYVANVQTADVSVVDIAPGSPTENQVVATVSARPADDVVGGRADGWEDFVIGGRAPRGIVFSDAQNALFVTSIGPQTGPRAGVVLVGGAIINPTITVIDAATHGVVAHVALEGQDPDRPSCTDPELMALDDARNRLYVTCQGSGTVDVLDTAALAAGLPAELAVVPLPVPSDVSVPSLALNPDVGPFGAKVCAGFTSNRGAACTSDADCTGCPSLVEGLPVSCCAVNNPAGLHNGPRGIALAPDGATLFAVNQFSTSIATLDVSPPDPTLASVVHTRSFPGAFGSDTEQRDRRLGQIEFFTDVKKTMTSCATCHIDDHQDGMFFEADVAGPRLRRVLSVRGTRDFPPLLQDQLLPDLAAFTDIVVHVERGGPVCTPCTELNGSFTCFPPPEGTCTMTSFSENVQNTLYAKAITFFPNPNLEADGSLSTVVPLPGGGTGNAVNGAGVFAQSGCQGCHPAPMFTLDQFQVFTLGGFSTVQARRMREVGTPVLIPLRENCQDANRPTGVDGSEGFGVPTLRGIWDTFPLLMSGSAGLGAVGSEPAFAPGCTPGSAGCCTQLRSPLNPGGIAVPAQHLAVTTKDALRAALTAPLAVPGTGHGAALGLSPSDLDDLIAYMRSL